MNQSAFAELSTTSYADVLTRDRIMSHKIRPLWQPIPRIAGPAWPVFCPVGDGTVLQIAIHSAPAGSVIVCTAGDLNWAMTGSKGCEWAKERGVAGLVIDGLVRDVAEIREAGFPVFGRGVIPIAGKGKGSGHWNIAVQCGGVNVDPGDIVVADEEGIVVLPAKQAAELLGQAKERAAREENLTMEEWVRRSRVSIEGFHTF